jgi:hypothetical protein
MGGGKETPRQKMIGMMYLVLMAMLAMNVSKSIIDAFVAIEENIQIANQNEYGRGNDIRKDVIAKAEAGDTDVIRSKAKRLLVEINKIDELTAKQIQYIDALKMEILSEIKESEDLLKEGPEEKGFIIEKAFNASEPTKPIRFRLSNVQNKDKYDEVMRIMGISNSTEDPETYTCKSKFAKDKKSGIDLWISLKNYRATICKILVESSSNDSVKYKFKDPDINQFETQESLKAEIVKQFSSKNWKVSKGDSSVVADIYIALSKREKVKNEHEKKMEHWIGKTFNHAPAVGALASLSSLQKEILTARADAITVMKGRIGGGDFSFNSIVGLATPTQAVVQPGAEIQLQVRMAAYDSDRQPEIKPNQGTLKGKPEKGVGIVTARATSGKMTFTGTVTITDKYNTKKTESYEAVVQVAAGGGAIELPEYQILYQGYDNFVVPSLSGSIDLPNLTASGCSVTRTVRDGKKGYIVRPGAGVKTVQMSISGKGGDQKPIKGISNTYKVKRFPTPVIKVSSISKSMGATIVVGLPGDSPLRAPAFTIKSVKLLLGDNEASYGANVPGSAVSKLKVNKSIGISVLVFNPITKSTDAVIGELKITN